MIGCSSVRILHVTTSFPLRRGSISGIFIYRLIKHLSADTEITVLVPDPRTPVDIPEGNFQVRTFRYTPKQWQRLAHEPGGLPAALHNSKWLVCILPFFLSAMFFQTVRYAFCSDVIHAHWTVNGVIAGLAGLLTRTPVVTTLRGEDVNRSRSSLIHRFLLSLCLQLSKRVVTVSTSMRNNLGKLMPDRAQKIIFVPNGIGHEFYAISFQQTISQPTILALGSLIPVKGVDLVIRALAYHRSKADWTLVIAGAGPEQEKLRLLGIEQGIQDRIKFVGQVIPDKVPALLATTDILVQASYREGRPNAVLEAMAAGRAVIGSDIDGIHELIESEKTGLLFPPGDIQQLTYCLDRFLTEPELREQLGREARRAMIDKKLTWPACARSYMQIYNSLAAGMEKN